MVFRGLLRREKEMAGVVSGIGVQDPNVTNNCNVGVQNDAGIITTPALTTAAGQTYTVTVFNHLITAQSVVLASVTNGTNTQGDPDLSVVTPSAGKVLLVITNRHASQALNGSLKLAFYAHAASG
jgi:hypothetical protein